MKLVRNMTKGEYIKLMSGKIVYARKNNLKQHANTFKDPTGLCFFPIHDDEKYGIYVDAPMFFGFYGVVVDIPEERLQKGEGTYVTIVPEYATRSYSAADVIETFTVADYPETTDIDTWHYGQWDEIFRTIRPLTYLGQLKSVPFYESIDLEELKYYVKWIKGHRDSAILAESKGEYIF